MKRRKIGSSTSSNGALFRPTPSSASANDTALKLGQTPNSMHQSSRAVQWRDLKKSVVVSTYTPSGWQCLLPNHALKRATAKPVMPHCSYKTDGGVVVHDASIEVGGSSTLPVNESPDVVSNGALFRPTPSPSSANDTGEIGDVMETSAKTG